MSPKIRRPSSIGFRLTAWYAAILTTGLGLFGGLIWLSMRHRLIGELDEDLKARSNQFESYFKAESANYQDRHLRGELEEFAQAIPEGSSIDIRGTNGFVFHHGVVRSGRETDFLTVRSSFIAGGQSYDLEVSGSLSAVRHTLGLLQWLLLSLFPVMIVIACMGGAWLSRRALQPVQDITNAARALSVENLSARLPVPDTGDELAQLTEVLNFTLSRLDDAMKTLSQFVADASHEIRTPLAVIRTTAELAIRRARTPESYRESLQDVAAQATRMTALVEDLLMLARADSGAYKIPLAPVDLYQVLEEVATEMRPMAELRNVRIEMPPPTDTTVVAGSRPALHRLFLVLIDNAVKYCSPGTEVIVQLQISDTHAMVTVQDFGPGIAPHDVPHIFNRFYRADKVRGGDGYGLGLALAQSIARAHGTLIEVESEEHYGSRFNVTFACRAAKMDLEAHSTGITFSQSSDC
jgi:signal transduction histidine kinase